jgi:hypothetical protein
MEQSSTRHYTNEYGKIVIDQQWTGDSRHDRGPDRHESETEFCLLNHRLETSK